MFRSRPWAPSPISPTWRQVGRQLDRLSPQAFIKKILRDARASLVEDGCNEILAIKGGGYLVNPDLL